MDHILIGIMGGLFAGFVIGLSYAFYTRDGIWPNAWAFLILSGGVIGAGLGALEWAF